MASGICRRAAPTVFGAEPEGWVTLLDPVPGPDVLYDVLDAAEECPTAAISVQTNRS